uniref:Uncharacterized protein n=1 Tax=Panagrolaimus superbus TaxID=310955 RepID=A0A914YYQ1_9BILA
MFWLILSILFVVVVQNVQTTDCTVAQLNELKTCYLTYLKPYGFDVIPTYNKYDSAQDKYRIHGWNGELYICNAGQQLIKCATDKLIDTCVTVDGFKYISGLTYGSSQEYVNDYLQMKYRCLGNGFKGTAY